MTSCEALAAVLDLLRAAQAASSCDTGGCTAALARRMEETCRSSQRPKPEPKEQKRPRGHCTDGGCTFTHLRIRRVRGDDYLNLVALRAYDRNRLVPLHGVELYPPYADDGHPIENLVDNDDRTFAQTGKHASGYMLVRLGTPGPVDRVEIVNRTGGAAPARIVGTVFEGLDGSAIRFSYPLNSPAEEFRITIR